jgi:hypothetical protein
MARPAGRGQLLAPAIWLRSFRAAHVDVTGPVRSLLTI